MCIYIYIILEYCIALRCIVWGSAESRSEATSNNSYYINSDNSYSISSNSSYYINSDNSYSIITFNRIAISEATASWARRRTRRRCN